MQNKFTIMVAFAFILGLMTSNFAMSKSPADFKVGYVDVRQVVSASKQVQALQNEQVQKNQELKATIKKAQTEIAKQKDEKKKQELIKKYENDITYLKNTNDKKYAKKLEEIDKSISKTIQTEAKSAGYDLVLSKSVVLYGGNDITAEIAKVVK